MYYKSRLKYYYYFRMCSNKYYYLFKKKKKKVATYVVYVEYKLMKNIIAINYTYFKV